jgi:hypothetical protein
MACRMISSCVCCCPSSSGSSCRSFSTSGISMSASVSNSEKVTSCCCCGGGLVAATTVSGLTPISVVVVGGDVSWLAMVIIYNYAAGGLLDCFSNAQPSLLKSVCRLDSHIMYFSWSERRAGPAGGPELLLVGAKVVPVRNKTLSREMQTHTWPASAEYT